MDDAGPDSAFRIEDVNDISIDPGKAEGSKCARSWKYSPEVGTDPRYPDVTPRDADALAYWDKLRSEKTKGGAS